MAIWQKNANLETTSWRSETAKWGNGNGKETKC